MLTQENPQEEEWSKCLWNRVQHHDNPPRDDIGTEIFA